MRNAIVIGSSGFLGSAVTRRLLVAGFHVYATKNRREINQESRLTVIDGGIQALTTAVLDQIGPEVIFHCARPVMPRFRRWGRVMAAFRAKQYNRALLSQIGESRDKPTLVFASGSLVYGNSPLPHDETAVLNPVSYARQYHRGESPVLDAIHQENHKVIMLRFPWLLGDGSWFSWFYLKPLREKKLVPLFGDGSNMMSVIGLEDAAKLMVEYSVENRQSGIYNVIAPHVITQRAFAESVASHYGGVVTEYGNLYPQGLEKAVLEAFTSNILLGTIHPESFAGSSQTLNQLLSRITL
ncbi:MAG: NAD-dependent epimerase/dehydratase family protein [Bacteroidales bacterium]